MATSATYPGVYVEEIPSGVRTITGVATSIAAFIGYFKRGPMNEAKQIFSWGDFEREYGGLDTDSEASYAIKQFFLNGGTEAYVVRTVKTEDSDLTAVAAAITIKDGAGSDLLSVNAANEGSWGNNLRIEIDYNTTDPTQSFNLSVYELDDDGDIVTTETFRNLNCISDHTNNAADVVNDGSSLVQLEFDDPTALPTQSEVAAGESPPLPAANGTMSGAISKAIDPVDVAKIVDGDSAGVSLNSGSPNTVTWDAGPVTTASALAREFQSMLREISGLEQATVEVMGTSATDQRLAIKSGTGAETDILTFTAGGAGKDLVAKLGLTTANVQQYALEPGDDGSAPGPDDLKGSESEKTGIYALLDVDLFNILCIPDTMNLTDLEANTVATEATVFCNKQRAFYLLDIPQTDKTRDEVDEIKEWLDDNADLRDKNVALYYPRPKIADQNNDYRLRTVASSGTIAGLFARIDADRGFWKAPAGTEAKLKGVQELEYLLTDSENGTLNPLAINCLRSFPVYGSICWGARTLNGSDQEASEWKYIPVRRVALYIEESLYRGLQWVVFEANDQPLWSQIRLNVGAFMHGLFRKGAFQGTSPKEAYLVKCDSETTTQNDIDLGIVNIIVGFAPLKPAEFVIIKLQQIAGQVEV